MHDMKTYRICYLCEVPTLPRHFNRDWNFSDICNRCMGKISVAKHLLHISIVRSMKHGNQSFIWNFLPYDVQSLRLHFESQFESCMNWNNHGVYSNKTWIDNDVTTWTWQVDHIIPQSKFLFNSVRDEDFYKCWDLVNLRPYSSKQNKIEKYRAIND